MMQIMPYVPRQVHVARRSWPGRERGGSGKWSCGQADVLLFLEYGIESETSAAGRGTSLRKDGMRHLTTVGPGAPEKDRVSLMSVPWPDARENEGGAKAKVSNADANESVPPISAFAHPQFLIAPRPNH
ncbi:hypothetical protein CALVIDRAFT_407308 [Calocera viscosa TUFC12733]|uniref:Uncharacterized protein n=1 Tax=Calocera viscosa (strain TUFC12733) TaxID=1330018 RepID=A0A167PZ72_CALVF|nr:hypothetical protein CALVIDRAFT_407308 [Calocera viscosa TUFC12733]